MRPRDLMGRSVRRATRAIGRAARSRPSLARSEEGFTIIEVLVAVILLVVGIGSTLTVFDSSRRLTTVSERQTTLAQRAQNELERVLSLPWNQVALTGISSSWSTTPGDYTYVAGVSGGCPQTSGGPPPTYQPDHSPGGSTATEPLVINGCTYSYTLKGSTQTVTPTAGTVPPVQSWSAPLPGGGTVGGSIYDFITWTTDPTCSQTPTPGSACATTDDYKRVTVVVTQNGATHPSQPAIVAGFVTPLPSGPGPVNSAPGNTCVDTSTIKCTPVSYYPNCQGQMSTTPPTGTGGSCPLPSGPCLSPPTGTPAWPTPAIPAGANWSLTGTGDMTAYLQGNNGQAVSGTLCLAIYLYPQGVLGGLPPIALGTPQGQPFTVAANAPPTPITFDFNVGSGDYLIASTGLAQLAVELWVSGSVTPVNFDYGSPATASQVTLLFQG
jgi:type II secretory pathway pseudopilin PulG